MATRSSSPTEWEQAVHDQEEWAYAPAEPFVERPERLVQIFLGIGCFLLSWHSLRIGTVNFTLSDFLIFLAFLIVVTRGRLNLHAMSSMTAAWCIGLAMMLGGLLIGSIVNADPLRWANIASQYLFGFLLLPMIFMSEEKERIKKYLVYFLMGVALAQAIAITVSYTMSYDQSAAIFGPSFVAGNGRIGGMVSDANLNGAVNGFALVVLANALSNRLIRVPFAILIGVVLLWGLLASASFTAFSAAMIAIVIYMAISNIGALMKFGVPLFLFGAAYIAFGLPLPEAFSERVLGAVLTGNLSEAGTYTHRASLIKEAWEMSGSTLFIGLGVDQYRVESAYGMPVHQFPLILLTEGGLLSLAGLLALFLILGLLAMKSMQYSRYDGAMMLGLLVILVIFSTSIPHMYNRVWIAPMMLAVAANFARAGRIWIPAEEYEENYDGAYDDDGSYQDMDRRGPFR